MKDKTSKEKVEEKEINRELIQYLSEKIRVNFDNKSLAECNVFIKKIDLFWKNLPFTSSNRKKKYDVRAYLASIWGKKIPFLTLSKLYSFKKKYYDVQISSDIIRKNSFLTPDNYVLIKNKEQQ